MKILAVILILIIGGLWLTTWSLSSRIEAKFPPIGTFATVNGAQLHYVDTGKPKQKPKADAPAILFIHGASGNLRDQMHVYSPLLEDDFRLLFPDRPGQGYSDAFQNSYDPQEQAKSLALLMEEVGVEKAVISGHSWGGAVAVTFAVLYPEKTAGLILLAPVAYPWGTGVDWHFDLGSTPVIGPVFTNLIAVPAGNFIYSGAIERVFAPNPLPDDYEETSGTRLALRPKAFLANARDVANVEQHVIEFHPRYKEIDVPTYIFHGDQDTIVSPEIHSINGLSKDVQGAKLEILKGVGHKPDYVIRDKVVAAIREIARTSQ